MRVESPEPDGLGQEMEIDQCNESHAKAQRRKGNKAIILCGLCDLASLREIVYFFTTVPARA